ncbi:hypothetical protein LTS10_000490 [Elasticomyces elasticus]|nr:hypothetical protein LTS10_000490 [Elasticomyces elasticus]
MTKEAEREKESSYLQVARSLHNDRLVDVYVGDIDDETEPYRVQQVVLEKVAEYFAAALRPDTFSEGQNGRLHFPDDDTDVWQILLQWAIQRVVPCWQSIDQDVRHSLLVRCWVTADKYGIQDFQNEIMLEALMSFRISIGIEALYVGVKLTAPGSALRRLVSEELVYKVYTEESVKFAELNELDGTKIHRRLS